jgi:hypothetical protein
VLDAVLTRAPGREQCHELRTADLATADGRRYLSGRGHAVLRQGHAAVHACQDQSLRVIGDGAAWIRTVYRAYLAAAPGAEMVLDWYHLTLTCREVARAIHPALWPRALATPARRLRQNWAHSLARRLVVWYLWGDHPAARGESTHALPTMRVVRDV